MRLHALVYAALGNVPLFGLVYDPKVQSFLSQICAENSCVDVNDTEADIEQMIFHSFENFKAIEGVREEKISKLKKSAQENCLHAQKFLESEF